MECVIDTTVLIDLWRNQRNPAVWLQIERAVGGRDIRLPWMVEAEFLRGAIYKRFDPEVVQAFLAPFDPLPILREHARRVAETAADLQRRGFEIGVADLWIAAAAMEHSVPVVTRNAAHFQRVAGLEVLGYELPK